MAAWRRDVSDGVLSAGGGGRTVPTGCLGMTKKEEEEEKEEEGRKRLT